MSAQAGLAAILEPLTPSQREAALAEGRVLVLAGAGTGKTKTLTAGVATRIRARGMLPARILCVTFTNKAAAEMRERITGVLGEGQAPTWLGTFHGLGARQLRAEPEVAHLRSGFDIRDADDSLAIIRRIMKGLPEHEVPVPEDGKRCDARQIKKMAERIGHMKDELVRPEEAWSWVAALLARRRAAHKWADEEGWTFAVRLYGLYQATLREQNAADFGDLLLWPTLALLNDKTYRRRWSERFTAVLADEFQDVNHGQMLWLKLMSEHSGELFCVGDDSQSIYSWRGAKISFIRNFQKTFPGATLVKLEENFRSTGRILAAANPVIAFDEGRIPKTLYTKRDAGELIEVVDYGSGEAEAHGIAAEMGCRAADGVAWRDMAIIYRQNRLSRALEEALLHARIPYEIIGDVGFYHRAVVKDALALLVLSGCPESRQSDEAFRRVANLPKRGLGAKGMGEIEREALVRGLSLFSAVEHTALPPRVKASLTEFCRVVRLIGMDPELRLCERIELLVDKTGYKSMLRDLGTDEAEDALGNLNELVTLSEGFVRTQDLLEHAALATSGPKETGGDRVQLMTMHRAKGLEFGHVFLPGWEEAVFPGTGERNYEEERRLAYVALTRAMYRATITWAGFRHGMRSDRCGFVDEIPLEHRHAGWLRKAQQGEATGQGLGPSWQRARAQMDALGLGF
ncbi:ATP-dependent helicase [Acetobacter estunensis]|uniref:ATP-dependent helicase n=1 Tax=Acetobacter estunensis TaxID=104097 RepID=UPI0034A05D7B